VTLRKKNLYSMSQTTMSRSTSVIKGENDEICTKVEKKDNTGVNIECFCQRMIKETFL